MASHLPWYAVMLIAFVCITLFCLFSILAGCLYRRMKARQKKYIMIDHNLITLPKFNKRFFEKVYMFCELDQVVL